MSRDQGIKVDANVPSSGEVKGPSTERNSIGIITIDIGLSAESIVRWYVGVDCDHLHFRQLVCKRG